MEKTCLLGRCDDDECSKAAQRKRGGVRPIKQIREWHLFVSSDQNSSQYDCTTSTVAKRVVQVMSIFMMNRGDSTQLLGYSWFLASQGGDPTRMGIRRWLSPVDQPTIMTMLRRLITFVLPLRESWSFGRS